LVGLTETVFSELILLYCHQQKKKYTNIIENILNDGVKQGVFRKNNNRLTSFGIIGMCNWVHKWYKEGKTQYTPEKIADHFVNLLEAGYMNRENKNREDMFHSQIINNDYIPSTKNNALKTIKAQCNALINLIEQVGTPD